MLYFPVQHIFMYFTLIITSVVIRPPCPQCLDYCLAHWRCPIKINSVKVQPRSKNFSFGFLNKRKFRHPRLFIFLSLSQHFGKIPFSILFCLSPWCFIIKTMTLYIPLNQDHDFYNLKWERTHLILLLLWHFLKWDIQSSIKTTKQSYWEKERNTSWNQVSRQSVNRELMMQGRAKASGRRRSDAHHMGLQLSSWGSGRWCWGDRSQTLNKESKVCPQNKGDPNPGCPEWYFLSILGHRGLSALKCSHATFVDIFLCCHSLSATPLLFSQELVSQGPRDPGTQELALLLPVF